MELKKEIWHYKWQSKRLNLLLPSFGVRDVLRRQYEERGIILNRDLELFRLKSVGSYANPASEPESTVPYFGCKFCPETIWSDVFVVADESGNLSLHKIPLNPNASLIEVSSVKVLNNAIFSVIWMPGELKILAFCGDHTSRLYDVGGGGFSHIATFEGHAKSVKTGDFMPEDPAIFATGARDGVILLYDSRASVKNCVRSVTNNIMPDQCIMNAAGSAESCKKKKPSNYVHLATVTALAFQDRNNLLCCGATDELIRCWDMRVTHSQWRGMKPKAVKKTGKGGYNDMLISRDRTKMYASSHSGPISCFNLNSIDETPIAEFCGHEASSFYVKTSISADGEYLVSGSTDRAVYMWRTSKAELETAARQPFMKLAGHKAEVTGVDMTQLSRFTVVSCGEDGTLRSWLPSETLPGATDQELGTVFAERNLEHHPARIWHSSNFRNFNHQPTTLSKKSISDPRSSVKIDSLDSVPVNHGLNSSKVCPTTPPKREPITPSTKAISTIEADILNKMKRIQVSPPLKRQRGTLSPIKNSLEYKSPTLNLPNYVEEGNGPWHSCPRVGQKENLNWLTEMRRKSTDKRGNSVEKERRRNRIQSSKKSSRRTLFEFYKKKSSKGLDEPVKGDPIETAPNPSTASKS